MSKIYKATVVLRWFVSGPKMMVFIFTVTEKLLYKPQPQISSIILRNKNFRKNAKLIMDIVQKFQQLKLKTFPAGCTEKNMEHFSLAQNFSTL